MRPEQRLLGYDVQDKKFIDMQTGKYCTQKEIHDFIEYLFQRYNIDSQELKIYYNPIEQVYKSKLTNEVCTHEWINEELARVLNENVSKQTCTPKEWDGCRVEKMGCEGCTYDVNKNKIVQFPKNRIVGEQKIESAELNIKAPDLNVAINVRPNSNIGVIPNDNIGVRPNGNIGVIPKELDPSKCRHCGGDQPAYCEECYQLLVNRITCLQAIGHDAISKNSVLEFMNGLRNILLSGERPEIKLDNIKSLYIQYDKEFDNWRNES